MKPSSLRAGLALSLLLASPALMAAGGDLGEARPLLLRQLERRDEAKPVDDTICHLGRDDLAAQPVRLDRRREARLHRLREGRLEQAVEHRIGGDVARLDRRLQRKLAVAQQHRQFRPGEAEAFAPAPQQRIVAVDAIDGAIDPPRRLGFTWGSTGGVTIELKPEGDEVLLTLTHRRIEDRGMRLNIAAGWHAHLDVLVSRVSGEAPPPFWDAWVGLKGEYERRLPQ